MTIHDLSFIKHPEYASWMVRNTYFNRIEQCLKYTDSVITFSQHSKKDIIETFKVKPEKIYLTSQASRYEKVSYLQDINHHFPLLDSFKPYLLFVSNLEPRKNIGNLIKAFEYLKKHHKIEHNLIIIGQKGWRYQSILSLINKSEWKQYIHHLGYLSDKEVALFYTQADVFVYPSYYEGFGLPVLEAMSLGAPVVTSNTSSLPEVAGDAAILINPESPRELADAILAIITNSQLRNELIKKGQERSKLFSWEKTARETLAVYQSLL